MRDSTERVLTEGLFTGLIGYGTAIVVIAAVDLMAGRSPFYTPALFGATLFYRLDDPYALIVSPGPVLAYNMVHLVAFLGLGLAAAWSARLAERYPSAQYLVLVLLLFVAFHVYAALLFFAQPLLGSAGWWKLGAGSVAAAIAMGVFLLRRHELLRRELREIPMGESR
jgi:hypothetical protein